VGRVVALDLGSRRIGVAASDPTRTLASPVCVVERASERAGGRSADHARLRAVADEYDADLVVVGLPVSLNGTHGAAAQLVHDEVGELGEALGRPIELADERFTTLSAHRHLAARGVKAAKRRSVIDMEAATVLLQTWLDGTGGTR
jgi:putative Holliday junction resolvase